MVTVVMLMVNGEKYFWVFVLELLHLKKVTTTYSSSQLQWEMMVDIHDSVCIQRVAIMYPIENRSRLLWADALASNLAMFF